MMHDKAGTLAVHVPRGEVRLWRLLYSLRTLAYLRLKGKVLHL